MTTIRRFRISHAVLLAWFVVISAPLAVLTAKHQLAFRAPTPEGISRLVANMPLSGRQWRVVHLLGSDCPCSAKIARYLEKRGPQLPAVEQVVLVGGNEHERELRAAGCSVLSIANSDDAPGVPAFLIFDEDGKLRHAGGYSPHGGENPQDLASLASLRAGDQTVSHPIFGCATSKRLRTLLTPFSRGKGL